MRLRDVVELDGRGGWRGDPTHGRGHDYRLRMVKQGGQWRISHPPDRLLIPRAHFDSQYQQFLLYFMTKSSRVLVPEPVYVPRGRQTPTMLVAGLLKGPEPGGIERTFLPRGTSLDGISVPVSRERHGRGAAQRRRARDRRRAADDASTPSSPGPSGRCRAYAGSGSPSRAPRWTCPARREDVAVDSWSEFDPSVGWASSALFGLRVGSRRDPGLERGGQRHRASRHAVRRASLDRGRPPRAARRRGQRRRQHGRRLQPGRCLGQGSHPTGRPHRLHGRHATCCGPPTTSTASCGSSTGGRRARGCPSYAAGRPARRRARPDGRWTSRRFVLSRDGTRLVVQVRRHGRDQVLVARVQRDAKGRVQGHRTAATARPRRRDPTGSATSAGARRPAWRCCSARPAPAPRSRSSTSTARRAPPTWAPTPRSSGTGRRVW